MSDHLYLSSDTKAHQLAMLYLEKTYSNSMPTVDSLMDTYQEVFEEILKRVKNT